METQTETRQVGNFDWQIPEVALSFIQGKDAQDFYKQIQERAEQLGNPIALTKAQYDSETKTVIQDNFFISVVADNIARQNGMRGAMPYDENNGPLKQMVEGKHYTIFPCLDIRSAKHTYDSNKNLLTKVIGLVEEAEDKVKFPFRISGLGLEQQDGGYGLNVTPREDLTIVHDDRLLGKWNRSKFNRVDEHGLPVFDDDGARTWYAKQDGASDVCLGSGLGMGSNSNDLSSSFGSGRVVLVSGEAGAHDFLGQIQQRAEAEKAKIDRAVQKANEAYEKALK